MTQLAWPANLAYDVTCLRADRSPYRELDKQLYWKEFSCGSSPYRARWGDPRLWQFTVPSSQPNDPRRAPIVSYELPEPVMSLTIFLFGLQWPDLAGGVPQDPTPCGFEMEVRLGYGQMTSTESVTLNLPPSKGTLGKIVRIPAATGFTQIQILGCTIPGFTNVPAATLGVQMAYIVEACCGCRMTVGDFSTPVGPPFG
jgi:hypothetical protein